MMRFRATVTPSGKSATAPSTRCAFTALRTVVESLWPKRRGLTSTPREMMHEAVAAARNATRRRRAPARGARMRTSVAVRGLNFRFARLTRNTLGDVARMQARSFATWLWYSALQDGAQLAGVDIPARNHADDLSRSAAPGECRGDRGGAGAFGDDASTLDQQAHRVGDRANGDDDGAVEQSTRERPHLVGHALRADAVDEARRVRRRRRRAGAQGDIEGRGGLHLTSDHARRCAVPRRAR